MSRELDLDDDLIWESYVIKEQDEDELPVEDIKDWINAGESIDDIAEYFEVDEDDIKSIQMELFADRDRQAMEDEELTRNLQSDPEGWKFSLSKDEAGYKSTESEEGIPTDKIKPDDGEDWYSNRNTAGVPDVKQQKKRQKIVGRNIPRS